VPCDRTLDDDVETALDKAGVEFIPEMAGNQDTASQARKKLKVVNIRARRGLPN
jgi:hypothetical protein